LLTTRFVVAENIVEKTNEEMKKRLGIPVQLLIERVLVLTWLLK